MNIIHWCKVVLLSILLLFVSAWGAQAAEKVDPIRGFGPFTWGQSFSDIEKKYPVKDVISNLSNGLAVDLCSISAADVSENTFYGLPIETYVLVFYNGQLVSVNVKLKTAQSAAETEQLHTAYQQILNDFQNNYKVKPEVEEEMGEDGRKHINTTWEAEKENGALFYSVDGKTGEKAGLTILTGGKKHLIFNVVGPVDFGVNHFNWGDSIEKVKQTYGLTDVETKTFSTTDKKGNKKPFTVVFGNTKPLDSATERFQGLKIGHYRLTFTGDKLSGITLRTQSYSYAVHQEVYDQVLKMYSEYYQVAPKVTHKTAKNGTDIVEMKWGPKAPLGMGTAQFCTLVKDGQKIFFVIFAMIRL